MATDVEVVGFVLAGMPIIISALEHYGEGWTTMEHFRRYAREIKSVLRDLEINNAILCNSAKELLSDMVDSEELELLLGDRTGAIWGQQKFRGLLSSKLGTSYQAYVGTMAEVKTAMEDLTQRLDIVWDGSVSNSNCLVFQLRCRVCLRCQIFQAPIVPLCTLKLIDIEGHATPKWHQLSLPNRLQLESKGLSK